jgi:phenylalanyl-tRNA synthetase beta chain
LERVKLLLAARGYHEAVTYSFTDPQWARRLSPQETALALANPISVDLAVMRTSLWPGLLRTLSQNQNRQESEIRLFEVGRKFLQGDAGLSEHSVLAAVLAGQAYPEQWGMPNRAVDFYDVKSDVEALLHLTGAGESFGFSVSTHPALHPGQAASVRRAGQDVGHLGLLHPGLERALDLNGPIVVFELSLEAVQQGSAPACRELSKFPAIRRDLAFTVGEQVPAEELRQCVLGHAGELLEELRLFDVYRGKGVDQGRKSLAVGLTLRHPSRTLRDEEVKEIVTRVIDGLAQDLGAELRE